MKNIKKIAIFGKKGSFTHIAAQKYFEKESIFIENIGIENVFEKISSKKCISGIIPMENTTTGSISDSYDLLSKNKLFITGEIMLKIHHQLVIKKEQKQDNDMKSIKKCLSHPQAIIQCSKFFDEHPWIKPEFTTSTSSAAKLLNKSGSVSLSALSSRKASTDYNLKILKENIENNPMNITRFTVISLNARKKGDKISLCFTLKHKPASLLKALKPYEKHSFNLTKIESRPKPEKPFEYFFFVDFEITSSVNINKAIKEIKKKCNNFQFLGRYDKGKTYES